MRVKRKREYGEGREKSSSFEKALKALSTKSNQGLTHQMRTLAHWVYTFFAFIITLY